LSHEEEDTFLLEFPIESCETGEEHREEEALLLDL